MSSNICGNCANFKPKQGDKFFNCTFAKQAGVSYGMQVRADTRSCEAFSPIKPPPKPQAVKRTEPPSAKLCPWGRLALIAALLIIILLIAFGAYSCFSRDSNGSPAATSTPTNTSLPSSQPSVIVVTPVPSPSPIPIYYYNLGSWAVSPPALIVASKVETVTQINVPGPYPAPANTFFVLVTVTVSNGGTSSFSTSATDFSLMDKFGLRYLANNPPGMWRDQFPYQRVTVGPGQTVSGKILFTVANIASGINIWTNISGQYVVWSLGF